MYSQLGQDLWVLESTKFKKNGYFLEVGAFDGIYHSNTYLLESEYDWQGICVEPSSKYVELSKNRKCHTCDLLVYSKTDLSINFCETVNNLELSGIPNYFNDDGHQLSRSQHETKQISTISLTDLCIKYNAPESIDYLSIDTEGSELHILKHHDFDKYRFQYITIEHNRCHEYRENTREFLNSKGYVLDSSERFTLIDNNLHTNFDDWYIYKENKQK